MPRSILLVDDEPDDNFFHRRIISDIFPYSQIKVCENGEEAISLLRRTNSAEADIDIANTIDLILLDVNMPGSDGLFFLQELEAVKDTMREIPKVLILSQAIKPENRKKIQQLYTHVEFMKKPIDAERLKWLYVNGFSKNTPKDQD